MCTESILYCIIAASKDRDFFKITPLIEREIKRKEFFGRFTYNCPGKGLLHVQ